MDKYTWVDRGSSYLPSELSAAFLFGQLGAIDVITELRQQCFQRYLDQLQPLADQGRLQLPMIPEYCQSNYHLFHILLPTQDIRDALLKHLNSRGIHAVFHYVPLHSSPAGIRLSGESVHLPITDSIRTTPPFTDLSGPGIGTAVSSRHGNQLLPERITCVIRRDRTGSGPEVSYLMVS